MGLNLKAFFSVDTKNAQASLKNFTEKLSSFDKMSAKARRGLQNLANASLALQGAVALASAGLSKISSATSAFIKRADEMSALQAKLKQVTSSQAEFNAVYSEVQKIAKSNYSSLATTSDLYIQLSQSLKEIGYSSKQVLQVSDTLSKALKAGGASADESSRAIAQFNQAMSVGKLQGQDFKAMIQAAPSLLKYMSNALNVSSGQLREMASAGELTADKIANAFLGMRESVEQDFAAMPTSVADSLVLWDNAMSGFVDKINVSISATGSLSSTVTFWAETLESASSTIAAFVNNSIYGLSRVWIGLEGIWDSLILSGLDLLSVMNKLNFSDSADGLSAWIDEKRAEHSLDNIAQKLESLDKITKEIDLQIYSKDNATADKRALEATSGAIKQVSQTAVVSEKDILKAKTQALNAQIAYYKAIKDYAGLNKATLEKYELELSEQVSAGILKRSQLYEMLSAKRIELEKSAQDEIIKIRNAELDDEARHYEILGDYAKQREALLKKASALANDYVKKYALTSQKEIKAVNAYFQKESLKSIENVEKGFNSAVESISSSWENMISTMSKEIENGLFDALSGKGKEAFSGLGSALAKSFLSPFASALSSGVGGLLNGAMGGGKLANIATQYGLTLQDGVYSGSINGTDVEILSDGTIKKGNAIFSQLGLSDSTGNAISGALNIASGLKSGLDLFTNGVYGSITNLTAPISNAFANLGFAGASSFISEFGVGIGSAFDFTSFGLGNMGFGSAFAGGTAMGAGALLGGAGLGYGVGSLGDMLFGAKTKAGVGGAIGGAIGTAILPGVGSIIGSLLGSVVGGIFGSTKQIDAGVSIKQGLNLTQAGRVNASNAQMFSKEQYKSWFSKSESTSYSAIDNKTLSALNKTISSLNSVLDDIKDNDLMINKGDFGKNWGIYKELLQSSALAFTSYEKGNYTWKDWYSGYDKEEDALKNLIEQLAKYKQNSIELKLNNNSIKAFEYASESANKQFKNLGKSLGAFGDEISSVTQISAGAFSALYEQAIKTNFTPDNVSAWNELVDAYNNANKALKSYLQALREFDKGVYSALSGIKAAFGDDTSLLQIQSIKASFKSLNSELGTGLSDIFAAATKFRNMSHAQMSEFLATDTSQRTELVNYATQYAQAGTTALNNVKTLIENYKQSVKTLDAQIATIKDNLKTTQDNIDKQIEQLKLKNQQDKLKSELTILQAQQKLLQKFKSIADDLRTQVFSVKEIDALYSSTLEKARADYKAGNLDSESFNNLQKVASKRGANLENSASSAEQYRFDMLLMANEIENLAGKNEVENVESKIKKINAQLDKLSSDLGTSFEAQLKALETSRAEALTSANNQIAAINEQKTTLETTLREQISVYTELFAELGGSFKSSFSELVSALGGSFSSIVSKLESIKTSSSASSSSSKKQSRDDEINALYNKYLERDADKPGLRFWSDSSLSISQIETAIKNSQEALALKKLKPFANGGIVTRATPALIGEAGYPEAVIPLKSGKIPVDFGTKKADDKTNKLLEKIANDIREIAYTLRNVSDGEALYTKAG